MKNQIRYRVVVFIGLLLISSCDSSPDLVWTMVNVNESRLQGDAHLIQLKGGKTVLIDAGYLKPAQNVLIPLLEKKKIKKIDVVFISHPHRDHYEGLKPIQSAGIEIGKVFFNIPNKALCDREIPWGCNYKQIGEYRRMLERANVKIEKAKPGMRFDLGNNASMEILYAFDGVNTPVGKTGINDLSLIMMLNYNGYKMLFTGDLNRKIGRYLAKQGKNLKADILKVPHHGTEGVAPDSFFKAVNPDYAMIPAPAQLWCHKRSLRIRNWFQKNDVPVFVNGWHGNVEVQITGSDLKIIPEKQNHYLCE